MELKWIVIISYHLLFLRAFSSTVPGNDLISLKNKEWHGICQTPLNHEDLNSSFFGFRYTIEAQNWNLDNNNEVAPIFFVVGGEGPLKTNPYGFVTKLAENFKGLVVAAEHRFYGESLFDANDLYNGLQYLTPLQAMADYIRFLDYVQECFCSNPKENDLAACLAKKCNNKSHSSIKPDLVLRNNTFEASYKYNCPVISVGGSYPGFLSAFLRLRHSDSIAMAVASSAPIQFYSQEVGDYDYYRIVSEVVREDAKGCDAAVMEVMDILGRTSSKQIRNNLNICVDLDEHVPRKIGEEVQQIIRIAFANANMGNYPPACPQNDNTNRIEMVCAPLLDYNESIWMRIQHFLKYNHFLSSSSFKFHNSNHEIKNFKRMKDLQEWRRLYDQCLDLNEFRPEGHDATIRCGDISGCGVGRDAAMWDYQTCTYLVEHIGTNNVTDFFAPLNFSFTWLNQHCQTRFQVTPQPNVPKAVWGIDVNQFKKNSSYIIFSNGERDGWSAGGIQEDLSDTIIALNLKSGAHHVELRADDECDTDDVKNGRKIIVNKIGEWLAIFKNATAFNLSS